MPCPTLFYKFNHSVKNLKERYYLYRLPSLEKISKRLAKNEGSGGEYLYFSPEKEYAQLAALLANPHAQYDIRKPALVALEKLAINFAFLSQRIITKFLYLAINDVNNRIAAIHALGNSRNYLPLDRVDEVIQVLVTFIKEKNPHLQFRPQCAFQALNNLQPVIPAKHVQSIVRYALRTYDEINPIKEDCLTFLSHYISAMSDSQKEKLTAKLIGRRFYFGCKPIFYEVLFKITSMPTDLTSLAQWNIEFNFGFVGNKVFARFFPHLPPDLQELAVKLLIREVQIGNQSGWQNSFSTVDDCENIYSIAPEYLKYKLCKYLHGIKHKAKKYNDLPFSLLPSPSMENIDYLLSNNLYFLWYEIIDSWIYHTNPVMGKIVIYLTSFLSAQAKLDFLAKLLRLVSLSWNKYTENGITGAKDMFHVASMLEAFLPELEGSFKNNVINELIKFRLRTYSCSAASAGLFEQYPEFIQISNPADFAETLIDLMTGKHNLIILSGYDRELEGLFTQLIDICSEELKYSLFENILKRFAYDYVTPIENRHDNRNSVKKNLSLLLGEYFSRMPEHLKMCLVRYALDNMVAANKYEILDRIADAVIKDKSRHQLQPYFISTYLKHKNNPAIYASLVPIILKFYNQTCLSFAHSLLITKLNVTNRSAQNSNPYVLVEEVMQYAGLKR